MTDGKPIRPRARRVRSLGPRFERVAVDVVDLRAIETEMAAVGEVQVKSENFEGEAKSVEQFIGHGLTSLDQLEIEARDPGNMMRTLSVTIEDGSARIFTFNDDDHLIAGVKLRVEQILRTRVRRIGNLAGTAWWVLAMLGFLSLSIVGPVAESTGADTVTGWLLAIPVGLLTLAIIAGVVSRVTKGEILLVPRQERPGWLRRNRDGLIVQIVGGVAVLAVGIIIGRLT